MLMYRLTTAIVIATAIVFLLRYENTRENLGGVKKVVETRATSIFTAFSTVLNFPLCFYLTIRS